VRGGASLREYVGHLRQMGQSTNQLPDRDAVRVLVVADHAPFAEALMATLAIDERIEVAGCASNGFEAVSLTEALRPDVVLMDVHMPGMDGIAATKEIRPISPTTSGVIVTAAPSSEIAAHALAAGAVCYLTEDTPVLKLIDTILDVRPRPVLDRLPVREPVADALRAS
jgi:DNA-binding NarL/FixJ family response regulator